MKVGQQMMAFSIAITKDPLILSCIAGILFGIWPFLLKEAGLKGFHSPTAFSITQSMFLIVSCVVLWSLQDNSWEDAVIAILPLLVMGFFAQYKWGHVPRWNYVILACVLSGFGLLCLTQAMDVATNHTRGLYIATISAMQVVVAMSYHLVQTPGDFTLKKIIGFTLIIGGMYIIHGK